MYTDHFLKFADQDEAEAVLFEGEERRPKYAAVNVIGVIYKPTGNMLPSDSGDAVDEMAPIDGWHVNVRHTAAAPELDAYKVAPKAPVRGWA